MPITKSAKKALRQSKRRYIANKEKSTELKSVIKDFKKMIANGKIKDAKKQLSIAFKKLDKAAKTNLIKKNTANRLKSRLTKSLNKHSK
jgi:small subunit ribosomal protein S20